MMALTNTTIRKIQLDRASCKVAGKAVAAGAAAGHSRAEHQHRAREKGDD